MEKFTENATPLGLYDPQFEHDACGIGAVVDIKGRKSHQTVSDALSIVERLEHRAGKDAEGKTGDGVGIMLQISHKFFSKVAEELNISESSLAAIALGEATAKAVQRIPDAHCNGDMHAALDYAAEVKHKQRDFVAKRGISAIIN